MTELVQLIQWVFGGFWRWLGFAILLGITVGGFNSLLGVLTFSVMRPKQDRR